MMPASTATHGPYCALQCGIHLATGPAGMTVAGDAAFPVNNGSPCIKGWSAPGTLTHRDRLRTPLIRETGDGRATRRPRGKAPRDLLVP